MPITRRLPNPMTPSRFAAAAERTMSEEAVRIDD